MTAINNFVQAQFFAHATTAPSTTTPADFTSTPQIDIQYTSLTIVGSGGSSVTTSLLPEVEVTPGG